MAVYTKIDMTDIWASVGEITKPDAAKIAEGWQVEAPPLQWWNWFENRQDNNIAYIMQRGFAEWDAVTEYVANGSYVQYSGAVYKCTVSNTNIVPTNTSYWTLAFATPTAALTALGSTTPAANTLPYYTGTTTAGTTTLSAFARTILDDADAGAVRATIGAQAASSVLSALAAQSPTVNKLAYFTSSTTAALTDLSVFARSLLDDVDATTARTTLGLANSSTITASTGAVANTLVQRDVGGIISAVAIELHSEGATPFVDFKNSSADDFDARIILTGDDVLTVEGVGANGFKVAGSTVWNDGNRTLQADAYDPTAGRVTTVGSFGIGNANPGELGTANTNLRPGVYTCLSATGVPTSFGMLASFGNQQFAADYAGWANQIFMSTEDKMFFRVSNAAGAASYQPWRELWHTGNFDPNTKQNAATAWNTSNFNPSAKQDVATAWNTGNFDPNTKLNTSVFDSIIAAGFAAGNAEYPYFRGGDNVIYYLQRQLGFTPVQQGGGAGQLTSKIYIGHSASGPRIQVDVTDFGDLWYDANGAAKVAGTFANKSLAANGYQVLPGGLIIQWGRTGSIAGDSSGSVSFPVAFPNYVASITATASTNAGVGSGERYVPAATGSTTTGFTLINDGTTSTFDWIAIGY